MFPEANEKFAGDTHSWSTGQENEAGMKTGWPCSIGRMFNIKNLRAITEACGESIISQVGHPYKTKVLKGLGKADCFCR